MLPDFDIWLLVGLDSIDAPTDPAMLARASEEFRPTAELLANAWFPDRGA